MREGVEWRIRTLSKDDGDGNENGKKASDLDWRIGKFARAPRFFRHLFTFCEGRKHTTTIFVFFSWTSIQSLRIQLRKIRHYLPNWTRWNKRDEVWSSANSLFKWHFCSRRRPCCLSSVVIRLQNSRVFFSKSVKKSVKRGVRVLRVRLSPVSLSVFSLVPDLLFDCSRLVEYAKIRTVLQSTLWYVGYTIRWILAVRLT